MGLIVARDTRAVSGAESVIVVGTGHSLRSPVSADDWRAYHDIRRSVLFDAAWQRQSVTAREGGLRRFNHPRDGKLAFEQLTFAYAPRPEFKLVMLIPA